MEQVRIQKEMILNGLATDNGGGIGRFLVWENVPGALSSPGKDRTGEDFRAVLEELARIRDKGAVIPLPAKGRWGTAGVIDGDDYQIAWRVRDARYYGVPQRRRRIALVVDTRGHRAAEVLFKPRRLSGNPQSGEPQREDPAGETPSRSGSAVSFRERGGETGGGKGLLIYESDASHTLDNTGDNPKPGDPCFTLHSNCGRALVVENHPQDSRVTLRYDGVFQTLSSKMGTGGGNVPMILEDTTAPIDASYYKGQRERERNGEERPYVLWNGSDTVPTLTQNNAAERSGCPARTISTRSSLPLIPEICGRLRKSAHFRQNQMAVRTRDIVRRLTPRECERLQAYPDDWTDIGEWTDSKGKKHQSSDTNRYKTLGNSIATCAWTDIIENISDIIREEYGETPKMASLFDGIGGFPMLWENYNGKGTAVWASEIEEFPIAVTKFHFPEPEAYTQTQFAQYAEGVGTLRSSGGNVNN